jgi:serine/threonine protein kinase
VKGLGFKLPESPESNAILALEFLRKGSIEGCISELSPFQKTLTILRATLAVDFLHAQKVVHGDIKPSNLLMDESFNAKLSDFGAARAADGPTALAVPLTMANAPAEVQDG